MTGCLYMVPTPIGNRADITLRAIRVLGEVDLIASEDTRHSRVLLAHHGIRTRVVSYHQHSKTSGIGRLMRALETGDVAVISNAGMPSISDPGFELVQAAIEAGVRVQVLPGASAVTAAVVLAALPARGFIFMGFLPRGRSEIAERLQEVAALPYSLVIFEAPHRVRKTVGAIKEILGNRPVVAVRELSKLHEEAIRGTLRDLVGMDALTDPRGEWTLVIGPSQMDPASPSEVEIREELQKLRKEGLTARDAVRSAAESLGLSRSTVYSVCLSLQKEIVD